MIKALKIIGGILIGAALIYVVGPTPSFPAISTNADTNSSPNFLAAESDDAPYEIRPNNEAKILWADSTESQTEYALLYLHGFSASHREGFPIHQNIAEQYGMNLYLSRLDGHGMSHKDAFKGMTPQSLYDSAADAMRITKQLGKKVIVMSCSTGSTLSILLNKEFKNDIEAFVMFSPNIQVADKSSDLILKPWGEEILELMMGGEYLRTGDKGTEGNQYWDTLYHMDGLVTLKYMLNNEMTDELFQTIDQPLLVAISTNDRTVDLDEAKEFYDETTTDQAAKRWISYSDQGGHVFSSNIVNPTTHIVEADVAKFIEEVVLK